ncbi:MAG: glycyl-radical enzyme activating protein [Clostridia bacterium]|nr:glycyl-radical enzyme activating protein [Clostridia bacterium]
MKARVIEIKRFAVHDGDGIRTTLFLKGCPLACVWCHNPEGIGSAPQLAYMADKCIGCGSCVSGCPSGAHSVKDGLHIFEREKCIGCGKCEEECPVNALKFYGREMSVEELLPLLTEDREFYENSGGGVTLSGGECLCHPDFCAELLARLKEQGIHTAVDTCGAVSREAIDKVMPYTDVFLYDVKAIDGEIHKKCTGRDNALILENLKYIDGCGKQIEVRYPYVPDYNSGEAEKIGEFLSGLKNLTAVRVLAYHKYAGSKYSSLDMENKLPERMPTEEEVEEARNIIRKYGIKVI